MSVILSNGLRHEVGPSVWHGFLPTELLFTNRAHRDADVIWVSYDGVPIIYYSISPGATVTIATFPGHPWICRASDSGEPLLINGAVFYLIEPDEIAESPEGFVYQATISEPLQPLKSLCFRLLQKLNFTWDQAETLGMPSSLVQELKTRSSVLRPLKTYVDHLNEFNDNENFDGNLVDFINEDNQEDSD